MPETNLIPFKMSTASATVKARFLWAEISFLMVTGGRKECILSRRRCNPAVGKGGDELGPERLAGAQSMRDAEVRDNTGGVLPCCHPCGQSR